MIGDHGLGYFATSSSDYRQQSSNVIISPAETKIKRSPVLICFETSLVSKEQARPLFRFALVSHRLGSFAYRFWIPQVKVLYGA
jgi:hypothetical protein